MSTTAGEDLSQQSAYIFAPSSHVDQTTRPSKRRKVSKGKSVALENPKLLFIPLLNGLENQGCVQRRQDSFDSLWDEAEGHIQEVLSDANETTLSKVADFVSREHPFEDDGVIPTGLIVTGPNISSQSLLFDQLAKRLRDGFRGPVVTLRSGDASNLKSVLKKLNRDATDQKGGVGDEEPEIPSALEDGKKPLNYDLQILQDYVKVQQPEKVVVAFQDTEAFDSNLLANLIELFSSCLDRIPFVLLFGIATSVELFKSRLPTVVIRCLSGAQFDVEQTSTTFRRVFQQAVASPDAKLRLGPSMVRWLVERQHDHLQSVQAFTAALKYAYMCHFYANPLSIIMHDTAIDRQLLQPEHFESIRMLPSFRSKMEEMLVNREAREARVLLEDDDELFQEILKTIKLTQGLLLLLLQSCYLLSCAASDPMDPVDIYVKAFSGTLGDSEMFKNVIDSIKRMSVADVSCLAKKLIGDIRAGCYQFVFNSHTDGMQNLIQNLQKIKSEADALDAESKRLGKPLRSKYSTQKTLRTTVVAQKVQLSMEALAITEQDNAFSALIDRVIDIIEDLPFDNPQEMFLHELWLYDIKAPHQSVFTPKLGVAIERALSEPHQYLNCGCCDPTEGALSSSQPKTALLYQLYLESGKLINVFDLWCAFYTIVGGEEGEGSDERTALAQFYQGLAGLKAMGMVKGTKKKTDHLVKMASKGL